MRRPRLSRWIWSALLLIALFGGGFLSLRYCEAQSRIFDEARWRSAAPGTRIRNKMAGDLVASRRLDRMTRSQVLALLGPPDSSIGRGDGRSLSYNLGMPEIGIDDDILRIDLDERGVVKRYEVYSS